MTERGFKIETDPGRNHLRLTYSGFLEVTQLTPLEREMDAAYARLAAAGHPRGSHLIMIDLRDQGVQSQEVIVGLQALSTRFGPLSRRVAMLMSDSKLALLQLKRSMPNDSYAAFHNERDALTWLFNGEDAST